MSSRPGSRWSEPRRTPAAGGMGFPKSTQQVRNAIMLHWARLYIKVLNKPLHVRFKVDRVGFTAARWIADCVRDSAPIHDSLGTETTFDRCLSRIACQCDTEISAVIKRRERCECMLFKVGNRLRLLCQVAVWLVGELIGKRPQKTMRFRRS